MRLLVWLTLFLSPVVASAGVVVVDGERFEVRAKIAFPSASSELPASANPVLDEIAAALATYADIDRVVVEGHTDNAGDAAKNKDLSDRRAKAVVKYLTDKGIAADRLVGEGFGQERPIADNATEEGKANNRRVDFAIVQGT